MIRFRFKKFYIAVNFSFLAIISLAILFKDHTIIGFGIAACLLHEIGHLAVMLFFRVRLNGIVLYGAGISIKSDDITRRAFFEEVSVITAGIVVNIAAALFFLPQNSNSSQIFAVINLMLAAFNLLPLANFDGGRLRTALIDRYLTFEKAQKLKKLLKLIDLIVIFIAALLLMLYVNFSLWLLSAFVFLVLISDKDS
jgi:stage IV sporulation protein FB